MSSLGIPIDSDVGYFVTEVESGMYTYWRQEVPAGITSVSELVFFGIRSSWSSSRSNRSGVPGGTHGFVQTDFDMRFQFFFRDGSEPVTVIRPIDPVFLTTSQLTLSFWYDLYVATDLLEEVPGREVKYVSISSVPAPDNVVSDLVNFLWGSKTVDTTSEELTAEFSPNGGRDWYPLDSTGERVQASLCIKP